MRRPTTLPAANARATFARLADLGRLLRLLDQSEKLRKGNYERLLDTARLRVRAWEKANANAPRKEVPHSPISGPGVGR